MSHKYPEILILAAAKNGKVLGACPPYWWEEIKKLVLTS